MKVQMDPKKMDMDILDQIISKCEDHMISPFKKKSAVVAEVEPEEGDEGSDEGDEKSDLSDMDLEDLLKMYQEHSGK
jgi:hypothetical protein